MYQAHPLVQLIYAQSLCFVVAWGLAYVLGHRIRRGHWLVSLVCLGGMGALSHGVIDRLRGPAPSAEYWIPAGLIAVAIVALADEWNALGHACMAATLGLSTHFLAYLVLIMARSRLGPLSLLVCAVLLVLQAFALLLLCAGSYEILDVLCRIRWRRTADPRPSTGRLPRVSLHVPCYNEPPEMVIETLESIARLDYPDYEVVVIDNNTTDERLWRPVEEHCRRRGFRFFHLDHWPGFKSGALNFALGRTDPVAEIVGVIDSDYIVEPDYLRRCVGFLESPSVAFVQTPQDYRDVAADDRYALACYDAYLYFFRISMAGRNEHNGIIFAGTMGLIRRDVLTALGGWDEWCITEDAEISLRILDRGYEGVYVERSFGHGLMPLNFEGLKKQRFRWAFGGMQILRRHWRALVPWARWSDPEHHLSFAQQWDYLMGGLQWLNDPLTFAFTVLLLLGSTTLLVAHSLFLQPMAPAVLIVPFLFIFVGVSRFLWALRVRTGCGMKRALSAFTVLLGLTWVVTMACALGLVKEQGVFLRTPKRRSSVDRWHAIRVVSKEIGLTGVCLLAAGSMAWDVPRAPHVWVMTGLLVWQSLIYVSAPISSLWGHRSELRALHPEYLASSRTTGQRVSSMVTDRRVAAGVLGLVALAVLMFVLAIRLAPERERAFRTNPERLAFVPGSMMTASPERLIEAVQYFERQAALAGDVEAALALWDPQGAVRDANYTPDDPIDDRVWVGRDGVRRRYAEEFAARRYLSLEHTNASVIIEGDRAVIVNDLQAVIRTPAGIQRVFLSRGDRWTLTRGKNGWRISELIVNRAPR